MKERKKNCRSCIKKEDEKKRKKERMKEKKGVNERGNGKRECWR